MIPLRDANPTRRTPLVTLSLIIACFVAFAWEGAGGQRLLVAVNFAPNRSQCYLRLPFAGLAGQRWTLRDLTGDATYEREGDELGARGLYLDVDPWHYHVFELTP